MVLNEGTQQVNLTLTENYVRRAQAVAIARLIWVRTSTSRTPALQIKEILDTVAIKAPAKELERDASQSGILGGVVQLRLLAGIWASRSTSSCAPCRVRGLMGGLHAVAR